MWVLVIRWGRSSAFVYVHLRHLRSSSDIKRSSVKIGYYTHIQWWKPLHVTNTVLNIFSLYHFQDQQCLGLLFGESPILGLFWVLCDFSVMFQENSWCTWYCCRPFCQAGAGISFDFWFIPDEYVKKTENLTSVWICNVQINM